ncbi:hypothetical protein QR680_016158 [Steinernema hermaphroditum]|uniref:Uncharacterized protein n=1 Tax=Steinernema hermaphroditum TaxID=289476 RepID=A0AA39HA92_9BILA|nr:hypothetical protein QR680_016158 [Steinernema hermaphroditum]
MTRKTDTSNDHSLGLFLWQAVAMALPVQNGAENAVKVLRGVNDVHEYEHELLETYSQSSGSLSYDSFNPVEHAVAEKIRMVALKGTTLENLTCYVLDEHLNLKPGDTPQVVPVSAAALRELNRRHIRKPKPGNQRMHAMIPGESVKGHANSDLLELYDKTVAHYCASAMEEQKAFRLDVVCSVPSARPGQFRMDLIALKEKSTRKNTVPGAHKSREDIKTFGYPGTISQNEFASLQHAINVRKARYDQKRKRAERVRKEYKTLRGAAVPYPQNTAFGGMTIEKHVAKIRSSSTDNGYKLFK